MSETNTPPAIPSLDTSVAAEGSVAASLYPTGGGDGGVGEGPIAPVGEAAVGADTTGGTDTGAGAETTPGTDSQLGTDSVAGDATALSADSYTLSLPEGFTADDALLGDAKSLFASLNIPATAAQPLVDFYAKAATDAAAANAAAFTEQQTAWVNEINTMPEFQGEARATSLQAIGKVLDEYGSPEAKAALDAYGMGNNPALVKLFHGIATALSEGTIVPASRPAGQGRQAPRSVGQMLYPDSKSN